MEFAMLVLNYTCQDKIVSAQVQRLSALEEKFEKVVSLLALLPKLPAEQQSKKQKQSANVPLTPLDFWGRYPPRRFMRLKTFRHTQRERRRDEGTPS